MHGDTPPIKAILEYCQKYQAALIIDEAHTLGTLGEEKKGMAYKYKNHPNLFARVMTFGKAAGCHGGMVLGHENLIQFLINFSRAFIYTTAPSYDQLNSLQVALSLFQRQTNYPGSNYTVLSKTGSGQRKSLFPKSRANSGLVLSGYSKTQSQSPESTEQWFQCLSDSPSHCQEGRRKNSHRITCL